MNGAAVFPLTPALSPKGRGGAVGVGAGFFRMGGGADAAVALSPWRERGGVRGW